MAEPFGVPAGRVSSDVPGVIPGGPRPLPPSDGSLDAPEPGTGEPIERSAEADDAADQEPAEAEAEGESEASDDSEDGRTQATAVMIGEDEEIIDLTEEDREAIPTRSDDPSSTRWD
jgi:hypothetical protein